MSNCVGVCPKLLIIPSVCSRSVGSVIASRSTAPVRKRQFESLKTKKKSLLAQKYSLVRNRFNWVRTKGKRKMGLVLLYDVVL